jgi:hypothetical protein
MVDTRNTVGLTQTLSWREAQAWIEDLLGAARGTGAVLATGTIGGDPVELAPGTYRVVVLTEPVVTFDAVVVAGGRAVEVRPAVMSSRVRASRSGQLEGVIGVDLSGGGFHGTNLRRPLRGTDGEDGDCSQDIGSRHQREHGRESCRVA